MAGLVAAANLNQLLYMIPLVIAISLVYGATRHEVMRSILVNAARAGWWIISFMGIVFFVLLLMGWWV